MADLKLTDISAYGGVLSLSDLIHIVDVSDTSQNAAGSSYKLQLTTLKDLINTNIYTTDGTLSANRTVAMNTFNLEFTNGLIGIGGSALSGTRLLTKGTGTSNTTFTQKWQNSAGADLMTIRDDGNVGIGNLPSVIFISSTRTANDSFTRLQIENGSNGSSATTFVSVYSDVASLHLRTFSSGFSTSGLLEANATSLQSDSTVKNLFRNSNAIPFVWGTGTTEHMRLTALGNLGIGSTNPLYPISIVRDGNNSDARVLVVNNSSGNSAQALLQAASDLKSGFIKVVSSTFSTAGALEANAVHIGGDTNTSFLVGSTGAADIVFVAGGGASPIEVARLNISGNFDAASYSVGGSGGASFSGAITNLTVVNGIVTAAS